MKTWTGGCLCGALRYEATVSESENWYCHCRMCQKATGTVVSTSAIIKKNQLRMLKGTAKFYQSSTAIERGFCANCGSPMFFRPIKEDWISILTGTLDDPEVAPPEGHYGIESRISWLTIVDDLKQQRTKVDVSLQVKNAED
jgi:hypothetical protein